MTGHSNEKNFVGLATDGDYITCGSENNSLYMYYKVWSLKPFTFGSFSGHGKEMIEFEIKVLPIF